MSKLQQAVCKPERHCLIWHRWASTATIGLATYYTCRDCGARKGLAPQDEWFDIPWVISGGRDPVGKIVKFATKEKGSESCTTN